MSMGTVAWKSMYHAIHAREDQRPSPLPVLCRIASFTRTHTRHLA